MAYTGVNTSNNVVLVATDGTPQSLTLTGVTGDPSLGTRTTDDTEWSEVRVQGTIVGWTAGDEQLIDLSFTALDCDEVRDFVLFCHFEGPDYGPAGLTPTVTVGDIGDKAIKLVITTTAADGTVSTLTFNKAILSADLSTGHPASTWTLNFSCFDRS